MRIVDALTPADRGTVWRCAACTVAWIEGAKSAATRTSERVRVAAWCRLDYHTWIPLDAMPAGPFHDVGEHPDFSDYRDSLPQYHGGQR